MRVCMHRSRGRIDILYQCPIRSVRLRASFDGGVASVVARVVLHFLVARCIAAVFALLMPALVQHPVIGGLVFGATAF